VYILYLSKCLVNVWHVVMQCVTNDMLAIGNIAWCFMLMWMTVALNMAKKEIFIQMLQSVWRMLTVSWTEKKSNEEVLKEAGVQQTMVKRMLSWVMS